MELLETSHNYSLFLLAGEYFHAVPNALVSDPAAMERWLRLAEALPPPRLDELSALQKAALPKDVSRLPIGQAVAALLAEPEVPSSSPLREWLAGLEKRQPILEEDVRALLAKMGDGKSKREYIEPANREVSESRREDDLVQIQALSRRARRFLTVSDFGPALRDVEKARKLGEKTILGQGQAKALAILAARAQAGKGKLREAQQELESARLLNSDFELVRRDPYFRAFFASKFGRDFESNR
ncbi:MAG: hypothetical protein R3E96_10585 [Planctomycetota bacterium]